MKLTDVHNVQRAVSPVSVQVVQDFQRTPQLAYDLQKIVCHLKGKQTSVEQLHCLWIVVVVVSRHCNLIVE